MWAVWEWLAGSKVGRIVAQIGAVAIAVLLIAWRAYAAGVRSMKTKQTEASLDAVRRREKTDDEVKKLDSTGVRSELSKWMSRNAK